MENDILYSQIMCFLRKISIYVRNYEYLMIFISVESKMDDDLDNIEDN